MKFGLRGCLENYLTRLCRWSLLIQNMDSASTLLFFCSYEKSRNCRWKLFRQHAKIALYAYTAFVELCQNMKNNIVAFKRRNHGMTETFKMSWGCRVAELVFTILPRDAMLGLYAVVVDPSDIRLSVSVHHMPVLYRNDWTDRAGFWHACRRPSIHPTSTVFNIRK